MTTRAYYTSRTPVELFQRCPRRRYLGHHFGGQGIESIKRPLALSVGSAVHAGLADLLKSGQALWNEDGGRSRDDKQSWLILEDQAVLAALADFEAARIGGLELDASESPAAPATATVAPAQTFGDPTVDAEMAELASTRAADGRAAFDAYLAEEQASLVESIVRAYARRRLRPLLDQFEVLEVEREGEWCLWEDSYTDAETRVDVEQQIWFQSRPDALLLERDSRQLYLLSFKTTAGWDTRKARAAEHDMQGLTEGIDIERRLGDWYVGIYAGKYNSGDRRPEGMSRQMFDFLNHLPAPPRILGVRYEYLLKGSRWTDKDLTARFGFECRSQRSHLVRAYKGQGKSAALGLNWSWDYLKEGGEVSKLSWQNWKSVPVWEQMTVKEWIDLLDDTTMTMAGEDATVGMAPRELGWQSAAQATGFTATHPLDEVFLPPIVVYRNEDDLRDLVDSLEYQERQIVEHLAEINVASDDGERRHLLNQYFPMNRQSCEYPSRCSFVGICYGGEDIRRDPVASGLFQPRTKNHPEGCE